MLYVFWVHGLNWSIPSCSFALRCFDVCFHSHFESVLVIFDHVIDFCCLEPVLTYFVQELRVGLTLPGCALLIAHVSAEQ